MKKSAVYTLIAVLIVSIVLCGVLFFDRQSTQARLKDADSRVAALETENKQLSDAVTKLQGEQTKWQEEKVLVGKSIGSVKSVLIDSLSDLDKVSTSIGLVTDISAQPKETEAPKATLAPKATDAPKTVEKTDAPKGTDAPKATDAPKTTEAKDSPTPMPEKESAEAPKATPTPKK
jgi:chromosome segregation ATPase